LTPPPIVVFDLDNTLVHTRIDFLGIRRAIIERLVEAGVLDAPPPDPRVRAIPEWMELAAERDPDLAADLWRTIDAFEREGMLHGTVEADVLPVLAELRAAGYRLAVLTNNSLGSAEAALDRFELRTGFDLVLAREVVPSLKPSGAGGAKAHAALGGGSTVVVGDSYIDGLAAARAGVDARFVSFRGDLADLAARGVVPWARIRSLAELPALLRAGALPQA
jgi:phosphoglycolate phosphatase